MFKLYVSLSLLLTDCVRPGLTGSEPPSEMLNSASTAQIQSTLVCVSGLFWFWPVEPQRAFVLVALDDSKRFQAFQGPAPWIYSETWAGGVCGLKSVWHQQLERLPCMLLQGRARSWDVLESVEGRDI